MNDIFFPKYYLVVVVSPYFLKGKYVKSHLILIIHKIYEERKNMIKNFSYHWDNVP